MMIEMVHAYILKTRPMLKQTDDHVNHLAAPNGGEMGGEYQRWQNNGRHGGPCVVYRVETHARESGHVLRFSPLVVNPMEVVPQKLVFVSIPMPKVPTDFKCNQPQCSVPQNYHRVQTLIQKIDFRIPKMHQSVPQSVVKSKNWKS